MTIVSKLFAASAAVLLVLLVLVLVLVLVLLVLRRRQSSPLLRRPPRVTHDRISSPAPQLRPS